MINTKTIAVILSGLFAVSVAGVVGYTQGQKDPLDTPQNPNPLEGPVYPSPSAKIENGKEVLIKDIPRDLLAYEGVTVHIKGKVVTQPGSERFFLRDAEAFAIPLDTSKYDEDMAQFTNQLVKVTGKVVVSKTFGEPFKLEVAEIERTT